MASHRPQSYTGQATDLRRQRHASSHRDVTDVIALPDLGDPDAWPTHTSGAFDTDAQVMRAPELDDLPVKHLWRARHLRRPYRRGPKLSLRHRANPTAEDGVI